MTPGITWRRTGVLLAEVRVAAPIADSGVGPPATHEVHLLHIHGALDTDVPYAGGVGQSETPYLKIGLSAADALAHGTYHEPVEDTLAAVWGIPIPMGGLLYTAMAGSGILDKVFHDYYFDAGALQTLAPGWTFDATFPGPVTEEYFPSVSGLSDVWLLKDGSLEHQMPQRRVEPDPFQVQGIPGQPPGQPWSVAEVVWQFFFDRLV